MKAALSADTRKKTEAKPATFGAFGLKVKAPRIKKARRYSDVTVTRFDESGEAQRETVKAQRPQRDNLNRWEPEEVTKIIE